MNRLNTLTRTQILNSLCKGASQRACEEVFEVSNKTVQKLFRDAGDMAIDYLGSLRQLEAPVIQADELYSFVGAKQKNVYRMTRPLAGAGTAWVYLAICAKSRFVLAHHIGDRKLPHATKFFSALRSKLAQGDNGSLAYRPTIITDGLMAYKEAAEVIFWRRNQSGDARQTI
ncbi:hypothetical protein [Shimia sp. SDUM112013]|uniref:hypothetical protein n=1 Tax=Shimia sp. SDUM112013 TaxID=3136160 RepID=UPI0032EC91D2